MDIGQAIRSIDPTVSATVKNNEYDSIEWLKGGPISKEIIDAKIVELQAEYDNDYSRKREAEYPSIQECVHAILDDTLDVLQAKRASIKTKYPKGG